MEAIEKFCGKVMNTTVGESTLNIISGSFIIYSVKRAIKEAASYFRRNVPFIRKVRVLFKTRLIFPRINGPIVVLG